MATIKTLGLNKTYGKGESVVKALDGIDLTIEQGEFVAIVGRSGSGKTTMLDCMGLLMRPTSGAVMVDGTDASTLNDRQRAELRSRHIGFIFQEFNLLPTLSAMENILLPLRYSGGNRKLARRRAEGFLEEVGLARRADHRPTQMSGGEQQRVAIARSLINEPTVVLGDEPMGEVDTETANALLGFMRRINAERGVSFVIVTHDLELAARTDRVIRLRDGRVISDECPSTHVTQRASTAVPQAAA
ncbi:MAG TPA: ABC transporter ATP-binding protein [Candidatus Saccharimonadales bacterium]|nr:ABC transporter ATP-binding protein [Candidatus Saccharimonadales bacterium]